MIKNLKCTNTCFIYTYILHDGLDFGGHIPIHFKKIEKKKLHMSSV